MLPAQRSRSLCEEDVRLVVSVPRRDHVEGSDASLPECGQSHVVAEEVAARDERTRCQLGRVVDGEGDREDGVAEVFPAVGRAREPVARSELWPTYELELDDREVAVPRCD